MQLSRLNLVAVNEKRELCLATEDGEQFAEGDCCVQLVRRISFDDIGPLGVRYTTKNKSLD